MPPLTTSVASLAMLNKKRKLSLSVGDEVLKAKLEKPTDNLLKVKKMSRSDLEELVQQKIVESITFKGKYGELSRKFERISEAYIMIKIKASSLEKQLEDLEKVTKRIKTTDETRSVRIPKITRCVGIQVTSKTKLDSVKKDISADTSKNTPVIDKSYENRAVAKHAGNFGIDFLNDEHADVGRRGKEGGMKDKLESSNGKKNNLAVHVDVEQIDKEQAGTKDSASEPLKLSVKKSDSSDVIVITWTKRLDSLEVDSILNYELEGAKGEKKKWTRIGNLIQPLPLPMVCTLNKFKRGVLYNFRVKALVKDRIFFSDVASITL